MEKKNIDWANLGFGYQKTDMRYVSNFKDGEYFAAEYSIKCRPAIGVRAYDVELVTELPTGASVLMHPALRQQLEEEGRI